MKQVTLVLFVINVYKPNLTTLVEVNHRAHDGMFKLNDNYDYSIRPWSLALVLHPRGLLTQCFYTWFEQATVCWVGLRIASFSKGSFINCVPNVFRKTNFLTCAHRE